MDIAKIRKKALSKKMEEKAADLPLPEALTVAEELPVAQVQKKENPEEKDPLPAEDWSGAVPEGEGKSRGTGSGTPAVPEIESDDTGDEISEEMVELLTFSISHEEYAFRVPEVEEVLRVQQITAVPTAPDYVLGITSLRGKIIPVIDLQKRLNIERPAGSGNGEKNGLEKKIIIIEGPRGLIGAMIDRVIGVVRLSRRELLPPPGHLDEAGLVFIENIIILNKRFISVIHSDAAMDIEAG